MRGAFVVASFTIGTIAIACGTFGEGAVAPDGGAAPSGDASVDGPDDDASREDGGTSRCRLTEPFSPPTPLSDSINTTADETYASLSPDERIIYFARSAGAGKRDLWLASRVSANDPFGPASLVPSIGSAGIDDGLTVSADGLLGVFHSNRGDAGAPMNLYYVTRANAAVPFGEPQPTVNLNSAFPETDAYLLPDTRRLYFGSARPAPAKIFVADVTMSSASPVFGSPQPIEELSTTTGVSTPVVSNDEREIFFSVNQVDGNTKVFHATKGTDAKFGGVSEVTEVNGGLSVPSWLSADGCVLYLSSNRRGNRDVFVSTRGK